jgi:hypothetical protein
VLAGPILRRVEPNLVAVWVALSKAANVKLVLWENQRAVSDATSSTEWFRSPDPGASTLRVGDGLHLSVVTLRLPAGKTLQPERLYSYDLELTVQGQTKQTLKTLGLLANDPPNADPNGDNVKRLALGYEVDLLPCLLLPPKELTDLRLVHGSCRDVDNGHPDGLAWLDDLLSKDKTYNSALKRPHQLFLTGDQIYADEVPRPLIYMLNNSVKDLFGTTKDTAPLPIEQLPFSDPAQTSKVSTATADLVHFPPGRRGPLVRNEAGMTTSAGSSHVLSFGEFCAMYLFYWSNELWGNQLATLPPRSDYNPDKDGNDLPLAALKQKAKSDPKEQRLLDLLTHRADGVELTFGEYTVEDFDADKANLVEFHRTLPKVRRALANVPTYMIFDDHEITDDWYLNQAWRDRVMASPLGSAVVRNGMLAYGLFQGWGNDPVKFEPRAGISEKQPQEQLLDFAKQFLPTGVAGPDRTAGKAAAQIEDLLGLNLRNQQAADGHFAETNPKLKWFYTVPGPKHQVLVLDCRTRRAFASRVSPPGNIGLDAQKEQIPDQPDPKDRQVWFVVASLPVVGPPIFDELFAPLLFKVFDAKDRVIDKISEPKDGSSTLQGDRGTKNLLGTNPDAVEAWAFDPKLFENLLARLRPYSPVVLLSGDVHYSAANAMSYWYKNKAEDAALVNEPARFVQLISSGLKNVMPDPVVHIDRSLGFSQKLLRSNIGAERLGFNKNSPNPVTIPSNTKVAAKLRGELDKSPVMIPTRGWHGATLNRVPDWAWQVKPLHDPRLDKDRPTMVQPASLFPEDPAKKDLDIKAPNLEGYRRVVERHARQLNRLGNSRQILFGSALSLVTFQKRAEKDGATSTDVMYVIQELYTIQVDPTNLTQRPAPQAFTRHEAPLRDLSSPIPTINDGASPTRPAKDS